MKTRNTVEENLIWKYTHRDFRGRLNNGERGVLVLRTGGTCLVPLSALTSEEFADKLAYALRCEARALSRE